MTSIYNPGLARRELTSYIEKRIEEMAQTAKSDLTIRIDGDFMRPHLRRIYPNHGGLRSVFPPPATRGFKNKYIFRITARNTGPEGWTGAAEALKERLF